MYHRWRSCDVSPRDRFCNNVTIVFVLADRGRLNYLIVDGNAPLYKFGIKSATGGLFVAKTLDYESDDRVSGQSI